MRHLPTADDNAKHAAAILRVCGEPAIRSNWSLMPRETQVSVWSNLDDETKQLIKRVRAEASHAT